MSSATLRGTLRAVPRRLVTLCVAALFGACAEPVELQVTFPSATIRAVTQRVELHLFVPTSPVEGCADLDPRGKPAGNAPTRTGVSAIKSLSVGLNELPVDLEEIPTGIYLMAVEAYGPRCETVTQLPDGSTNCARLVNEVPSVLRGYDCSLVRLGEGSSLEANLLSFADVGSTMRVPLDFPVNAPRYDATEPLLMVDGEAALDTLVVQLLDNNASEIDGVPVHFGVVAGRGTIVEPVPIRSAEDLASQDNGIARATLRAGLEASREKVIRVQAHAAGYEGSPIEFEARAVPTAKVETSFAEAPNGVDLGQVQDRHAHLVLRDLDGDGLLDFVTATGDGPHRLVVGYGQPDRSFAVAATRPQPQEVRALAIARLSPGRRTVIAAVANTFGTLNAQRTTYVVADPAYALWTELDQPPSGPELPGEPTMVRSLGGQPMVKMTHAFDVADLDGDGVDELSASRCSYLFDFQGVRSSRVSCYGGVNDDGDAEITVLGVGPTIDDFRILASRQVEANDGGFRETHFGDINGDGSLDLAFVAGSELKGVCGNRFAAPNFELDRGERFDASIVFGNGYSFAFGTFDDRAGADAVAAGPYRASSPVSGLVVLPGSGCSYDEGTGAVIAGRTTVNERLLVRAADLNGDGYSEALLLQRDEGRLRLFFGAGQGGLAAGPILPVPDRRIGAFDVGQETRNGRPEVVAVVSLLGENRFWILRVRIGP